ncbi:hypothetical protein [Pleionea sp. CnH1-48]|uniref:hypothetical protein n=1 Tax=Pleionea sp. CnH1-48 TaxID=2954494 RepID=UPI002096C759|nr:hypothetical protein [Pleionea sp. CnH1-48]MCO7227606.1 hypothetical protein [Pleionea sp. CnH1-48]
MEFALEVAIITLLVISALFSDLKSAFICLVLGSVFAGIYNVFVHYWGGVGKVSLVIITLIAIAIFKVYKKKSHKEA